MLLPAFSPFPTRFSKAFSVRVIKSREHVIDSERKIAYLSSTSHFQADLVIILASELDDVLKAAFDDGLPSLHAAMPSKL